MAFDLFGCMAGPERDDIDLHVGDIRISFDRESVERDDPADRQQDGKCQDNETLVQREADEALNHFPLFLSRMLPALTIRS